MIPQGSILDPLLFLVFVNDLPDVVKHSMLLMCADDAKCAKLVRNQEDCSELQDDLNSLCSWYLQWNVKFKESKCILLRCCNNAHSIAMKYTMNNCEIPSRDEHRDLGVMFSSDLSFRPHYYYIVRRAYQVLGHSDHITTTLYAEPIRYLVIQTTLLLHCTQSLSDTWSFRPHYYYIVRRAYQVLGHSDHITTTLYAEPIRYLVIQTTLLLHCTQSLSDTWSFRPHYYYIVRRAYQVLGHSDHITTTLYTEHIRYLVIQTTLLLHCTQSLSDTWSFRPHYYYIVRRAYQVLGHSDHITTTLYAEPIRYLVIQTTLLLHCTQSLSDTWSFRPHYYYIVRGAYQVLGLLRRTFS